MTAGVTEAVRYVGLTSSLTAKYCLSCSDILHSATTKDRVSCTSGTMSSDSYWAVTTSLDDELGLVLGSYYITGR